MHKPDPNDPTDEFARLTRHYADVFAGRAKPDPREIIAVAVPVFLAEATVVILMIAGSAIIGQRTIWATIFGFWQ